MTYTEKVLPILRQIRPLVLPGWGNAEVIAQKDHSPVNVVTQVDIAVEEFASSKLHDAFPDIPFVGEEHGGDRHAERFWLMDPIDGTAHYVRGMPLCTSQIALVADGQVQFSAVYDFVNDVVYHAERGLGTYRDHERLHVSTRPLAGSYIALETRLDKVTNQAMRNRLSTKTVLFNSISAGWEYAMVAAGKLEGRITADPYGNDYDFLPGSLLVSEAGGAVANIGSSTFDYHNISFLATNPVIYKELTEGESAIFPVV